MKLHRLPLFAVVAAFALPQLTLNAQTTVATDPVGFTTINVTPGTGTSRKPTLLSIPLLDVDSTVAGLTAGTISAVTSNSIVVSNAGWTPGSLSQPATPFVIQITSGPAAGRFFLVASSANTGGASGSAALANTVSNIFISTIDGNQFSNNLANVGVAAGATFKLYACDTLSWFGTPATTGIRGGTSHTNSDNIIVTVNGTPTTYYFNTSSNNWVRSPINSSAANVALVPNFGVTYNRLGNSALSFVSTGQVPTTNRIVPIKNSGATILSQYWPVNSTLNGLGLQSLPGWVSGTNQASTDNVIVIANGTPTTYYYHVSPTATNWRRFPLPTSQDNVNIPIGAAIQISKKGSAPGYSPLTQTIPYSLN
jgi:hypothetical protein